MNQHEVGENNTFYLFSLYKYTRRKKIIREGKKRRRKRSDAKENSKGVEHADEIRENLVKNSFLRI